MSDIGGHLGKHGLELERVEYKFRGENVGEMRLNRKKSHLDYS